MRQSSGSSPSSCNSSRINEHLDENQVYSLLYCCVISSFNETSQNPKHSPKFCEKNKLQIIPKTASLSFERCNSFSILYISKPLSRINNNGYHLRVAVSENAVEGALTSSFPDSSSSSAPAPRRQATEAALRCRQRDDETYPALRRIIHTNLTFDSSDMDSKRLT